MTVQRCCSCTSDRNVYRELWTYVKVARPIERWHVPFDARIEHIVRDTSFLRLLRSVTKNLVITTRPSTLKAPSFDCHRANINFYFTIFAIAVPWFEPPLDLNHNRIDRRRQTSTRTRERGRFLRS